MRVFRCSVSGDSRSIKEQLGVPYLGVAIGNFDGMHRGHQALFEELHTALKKIPSSAKALVSFSPHPRVFFAGHEARNDSDFYQVFSFREKVRLAKFYGFDAAVFLRFNDALAKLSPEAFVDKCLCSKIGVDLVVVGDDWKFGHKRIGDKALLMQLAAARNFSASIVQQQSIGLMRASTSAVKQALQTGDLDTVQQLLNRRYEITGKIAQGVGRGRTLGFRTINLYPRGAVLPRYGVYAVQVFVEETLLSGVCNVGVRPTFESVAVPSVEVHLFNPNSHDLYGKYATLTFISRIRDEMKFNNSEELVSQIAIDIEQAKKALQ